MCRHSPKPGENVLRKAFPGSAEHPEGLASRGTSGAMMHSGRARRRRRDARANGSSTAFIRGSLSPYLVRSAGRAGQPRQSAALLLAFQRTSARLCMQVRRDRGRCHHHAPRNDVRRESDGSGSNGNEYSPHETVIYGRTGSWSCRAPRPHLTEPSLPQFWGDEAVPANASPGARYPSRAEQVRWHLNTPELEARALAVLKTQRCRNQTSA